MSDLDAIRKRHVEVIHPETGEGVGECLHCEEFWPCDTRVALDALDVNMERRLATDEVHEDDSYGGCVSCRIIDLRGPWDAMDDDAVTTTVPFPCAVVRVLDAEAALAKHRER